MLVNEFWKIPFLRLLFPFIAGIIFTNYLSIPNTILFGFCLSFIALAIVYRPFLNHNPDYHKRWIFGFIITLALFFTGAYLTDKSMEFDSGVTEGDQIIGIVNEPPKISSRTVKFEYKIKEYQTKNIWKKTNEKILLTLEKDSAACLLNYGDLIIIKGNLKEITNAGNPSEFDYKKYLARKHIHFKSYQKSGEWSVLAHDKGNPLFSASYYIREKMLNIYQETGIEGEEFGLLAALTLGSKDYLSDEIIEAYSDSGAMHVLSVSGLHVGIIFIVLNYVLFFLRKRKHTIVIHAILTILVIWFYALLTGLSPSVNRSAAMISLIIIGRASNKKPSTYNSVMASAFVLLFIEPLVLFDVGFQLSYLAVVSIIFFQQRIYLLFEIKNRILDTLWNWTTVSIAAQIGTSFLSIYYFHQFPVYAVFTNLFVVPVSFVIMVLAIALLFFSFITVVANFLAWILSFTVTILNALTKFVESLPGSTIEPISINSIESLLLHISLIFILIFIVTKNKKYIRFILISFMLAFVFRDFRFINNRKSINFTVYNTPKKSAFSLIRDGNLKLYTDTSLYSDVKAVRYLTSNIMADRFITSIDQVKLESSNEKDEFKPSVNITKYLILQENLKVIYLMGDYSRLKSDNKLKVNYIILSRNAQMEIEPLKELFDFDMLIADSSVPQWKQAALKKDCQSMSVPFYNVSESGAFVCQVQK